jgi:hypothetical protein
MGEREQRPGDIDRERVEAEFLERLQQEMSKMTVQDHLLHLLRSLPSMAFQYMGIYQAEGTKDLAQSRLAIDSFRALLDVMAPSRPPEEVAMYRSTLAQMQMAFVTATQAESERAEAGAGPREDEGVAEAVYDDASGGADHAPAPAEGAGEDPGVSPRGGDAIPGDESAQDQEATSGEAAAGGGSPSSQAEED